MSFRTLPDKALTTICFAHPAYRLGERFVDAHRARSGQGCRDGLDRGVLG